jgi:type II secretory pathway pseudopilin PulG
MLRSDTVVDRGYRHPEGRRKFSRAFSLTETLFVFVLAGILLGATVLGYLQCARRAEWSAYNLAAQGLAMKRLEQARSARWDTQTYPQLPEHLQFVGANFPDLTEVMDVPATGDGSNVVAQVRTSITEISEVPPLRQIRIDCVWPYFDRWYTNTVISYRAPDQ